ncbi:hypothetical protein [Prauserella muralis]|uniref:Uncharacterized protein n=1 Tax=Prauserella muralis TaxID=588067 RepID=A0A2V4ABV5_9PSEU|nr:hypothetical protein [Prauserella muralis]PXY16568.1 hypothetical protein BAY60_35820 [Prauserella muralis]TWE11192.1 hypothetical protein FHX69_7411 [Prauserella muralis]
MTSSVAPETGAEVTAEIPAVTEHAEQHSAAAAKPDKPVIGAQSAPVTLAEHSRQWAAQARQQWTPPDLWEHGRPPLKSTWLWARHGQHLPEDEAVRNVSRVTAAIRLPFRALCLYLDWIFDRDSRVVAAVVLVLVVIQAVFHPFF